MAYKFQAGAANLSGALEQQGDAVLKGAVTVASALTPEAADGAALGSATLEWSDLYLADSGVVYLGNDQDVTLTHIPDDGVRINAAKKFEFGDAGTFVHQPADARLLASSDGTFEIDAATTVKIDSDAGDISFEDGGVAQLAIDMDTEASGIAFQLKVDSDDLMFKNYDGNVILRLSDGLDCIATNDIVLESDDSVLKFGADSEVTLSHVHNTGLLLNSDMQLQFRDSTEYINSDANGSMNVRAATDIALNINGTDELLINATTATFGTNIALPDAATLGNASNADLLTLAATEITVKSNSDFTVAEGKLKLGSTAVTANATELSLLDAGVAIGAEISLADGDGFIVEDGDTMKKVTMSSIKTYIGGGSVAIASGSSDFTASVGVNFFNNISSAIECRLPAKSGLSAGESIIFKAGGDCSTSNTILIIPADGDSLKIDGENDATLESPYAAIEVVYISSSEGTEEFRIL